ncbi:MAG: hypothetical protein HPY76_00290 [Anaerolineae bacterium]|nr:hypothetical protein [Anaerolineae bacterium]
MTINTVSDEFEDYCSLPPSQPIVIEGFQEAEFLQVFKNLFIQIKIGHSDNTTNFYKISGENTLTIGDQHEWIEKKVIRIKGLVVLPIYSLKPDRIRFNENLKLDMIPNCFYIPKASVIDDRYVNFRKLLNINRLLLTEHSGYICDQPLVKVLLMAYQNYLLR